MGRGREVILEGGEQPGEERPVGGVKTSKVVNASARSEAVRRKAQVQLNGSNPRSRGTARWFASRVRFGGFSADENGKGDSRVREDPAATSGEKPLKGGCPWTNQHEIGLADPRHETSRER